MDAKDAEAVQRRLRRRILRAFVRRGVLDKDDRKEMEYPFTGIQAATEI